MTFTNNEGILLMYVYNSTTTSNFGIHGIVVFKVMVNFISRITNTETNFILFKALVSQTLKNTPF